MSLTGGADLVTIVFKTSSRSCVPPISTKVSNRPLRVGAAAASRQELPARPVKISPTAMIEAELSPTQEPVLGLYLHVAYMSVMAGFGRQVGRGDITPNLIGVLALLHQRPGMSQAELARLIGLERATVGVQIARAISKGYVRRDNSRHDGRRYALYITPRGQQMLLALRQRIPAHEKRVGARLTYEERLQLRALLDKLVFG
jgi:DNA-binding MarR family transcriptional regulator